jgi:hypothetical protein
MTTTRARSVRCAVALVAVLAMALCAGCAEGREINNPFVGPNGALDGPFGNLPAAAPAAPNS